MGLIYNPSDSHGLVSALNANIRTADEMIESLNRASKHLIDALGNNSLSGAAYTAGKGMFSQLVLPTISKASQALDKLKSEAKQYEGFASNAGEELLDEDKLNEQLENLQTQQAALSSQISFYNQLAVSHSDDNALNTSYSDSSRQLSSFMETTASDIQKVQEKLKKLHEFNTNVSSLFSASANDFKMVMNMVFTFSLAEFDKIGNYDIKVTNNKDLERLKSLAGELGNKVSDFKEWFNESSAKVFEKITDKVIKEGKNIGKSWGAKLQPRINGKFATDDFAPRKWLSGKLKGISNPASDAIGTIAKWGGRGLIALGAIENFNDYNAEYHNTGRAISYSAVATGIGIAAGTVGSAVGGAVAVGFGAAATGFVATVAAPVVGAVVVGAAVGIGVKAAYDNNFLGTRDAINFVGDKINDVGKAFSNPLKSLKGAFGW